MCQNVRCKRTYVLNNVKTKHKFKRLYNFDNVRF